MQASPLTPKKTPVVEGRRQLSAAGFEQSTGAGSQGELWVNKHGYPVWLSYFGANPEYFSTELLERALALKDERTY
jgi:hypothetical protein